MQRFTMLIDQNKGWHLGAPRESAPASLGLELVQRPHKIHNINSNTDSSQ